MKNKRRISWMLIAFLVVGMFSGIGPLQVQEVMASTLGGLEQFNQNSEVDFQVSNDDGKIKISNNADDGGFNSGGITNTSYIITPEKITGDFLVEAELTVTDRTYPKTSGVVGVGAFGGTGADDLLVAAVARGDEGARSYYQKADKTYGAGSPNLIGSSTTGTAISLKIERNSGKYTAIINGESKGLTVNSESEISPMYLGLVICGAEAEVDSFIIKQGENIIFDLDAPSTEEPSGPAPIPSSIDAKLNGDSVDITWEGEELTQGTNYQIAVSKDKGEYTTVKSYTYEEFIDNQSFKVTSSLTASGSYVFKVTGISGSNKSDSVETTRAIDYTLALTKPELTVSQDSGTVFLKWTPVKEATSYDVTVMDKDGKIISDKSVQDIKGTSADITELVNGEVYTFSITAKRGQESTISDVSPPLIYEADYIPTTPEWQSRVFGSSTNTTDNLVTVNSDNSVTVESLNDKGKISGSDDGIAFHYTPWDSTKGFQLTTKVYVDSFKSGNNQVAFGLMLRDNVGVDGDTAGHLSNFVAAGAAYQKMQGFYKASGEYTRNLLIDKLPAQGDEYALRIIKREDNTAIVSINNQVSVIDTTGMFTSNKFYIGLFAARNAKVTYSDIELLTNVNNVAITNNPLKTEYLLGEDLNLTGLAVEASFDDGTTKILTEKDYVVTDYDKDKVGEQVVKVNYGGKTGSFTVEVLPLTCLEIQVQYAPAKTTYYLNDKFDPSGMVIKGRFNSGLVRELESEEYELSGFDSSTSGEQIITVSLKENSDIKTSFKILVKAAGLQGLEIAKNPEKMIYFINEELDLDGMVVYAKYDDGSKVRLDKTEYTVSALDTTTSGERDIIITHKEETVVLKLTVKEKDLEGIEVTKYPKTTYQVGENFDSTGLEVSKVYDNLDKEILSSDNYTIDKAAFDNAKPGVYDIKIVPNDTTIKSIIYKVTVREQVEYKWNFTQFGQSISSARNYHNIKEDGSIELVALEGGGKVTGDHDGISFYYTEIDAQKDNFVLSADIKVIQYAKTPHDGQESFGIMARDAIGTQGDSSVFASNIAAVGGYSGGSRDENGTQLFVRTGVESSDGAGSKGVKKVMLKAERPTPSNTPYRLTLAKTNSGYTAKINNGKEEIIYEPDILNVQDSKIYVGFYTARLATIEVSNIDFKVTEAASDAPRVEPPAMPVTPDLEIMSLDKVSKTDYNFMLKTNVNGVVTIKKGNQFIVQDMEVVGGNILTIPTTVTTNSNTEFSVIFLPEDTQYLTSYEKIISNFTVTMKTFAEDGDIYVSPSGKSTGAGTKDNPLDLDTAITFVKEGQKIVMLDGTYLRNSKLEIKKYNDGTAKDMKYLIAAPGANPVVDFDKKSEGVVLGGNYWHIKGIDFARSAGNTKGFTVGGNYNIVELCRFYENGDTGLQISRTDTSENDKSKWPSYNLILNCTSFDNRDPSDNNADGFAAKLTSGEGNIFRGCIAHNNIDDGWDLYTKAGTGAIGAVIIENSIAHSNGVLTDGTVGAGDKNGFKLGGEGIHVPHIIRNSLAYNNGAFGFTSNSNPGVIATNNISYNNDKNLGFTTYINITPDFRINGFVSYQGHEKDSYPEETAADNNYMFNGSASINKSGVEFKASDFEKLSLTIPYERNENGDIIWGSLWENFLKSDSGKDEDSKDEDNKDEDSGSTDSSGGGSSSTQKTTQPVVTTSGKADVNPAVGGTIGSGNNAIVEIPKGALKGSKAEQVTVEKVSNPPAVEGNQKLVSEVYEFKVGNNSSYQFGEPVKITLSFDASSLEENLVPAIHYYDEDTFEWVSIGGKVSGEKIIAEVNHFTKFAVLGIKKTIELKDVEGHWAEDSIVKLIDMGAISGYPDGSFRPEDNITRAEFTKTLVKSLNLTLQNGIVFKDTENHWARDYIATASYYGIINGYDENNFGPNDYLTREQMAGIIINALGVEITSDENSFIDNKDISNWAKNAVNTAVKEGIISGYPDASFKPKGLATRAESVAVIIKALR